MAPAGQEAVVYSATYSNVPVYELNVQGNHVMRRRADDWINATHILKVADLDKPARTRVLEKEVQLDIHEKVQGGYGKYQGTWVPQEKAEVLAKKYNVYHLLKPILVFRLAAGDKTPPPAPKHTTAASNKTKAAKPAAPKKVAAPPLRREEEFEEFDNISEHLHDDDTPNESTIDTESIIEDEFSSRKRKRNSQPGLSRDDYEHRLWADAFLDWFIINRDVTTDLVPDIPSNIDINRPVDNEGHTAIHWAAAMGNLDILKDLIARGADIQARNIRGETPLIRAVLFSNCYDKENWKKVVQHLSKTIKMVDNHGGTIFHHIAYTTMSTRPQRAKYYLEVLLNHFYENIPHQEFFAFLNAQDRAGDTAFHVAVRHSRRCTKIFQSYGLSTNIQNENGETVDSYLQQRVKSRPQRLDAIMQSSSPVQGDSHAPHGLISPPPRYPATSNLFLPNTNLRTTSSKSFNRSLTALMTTGITDFLQAGEAELADRDTVLADTNRAIHQKEAEISAKRAKALELQAALEIDGSNDTAALETRERNLVTDGARLEEQIQHRALHKLMHHEDNSPLTLHAKDGILDKAVERLKKLELVQRLAELQKRRVAMTHEIVDATADAGMGPKGEQMKGIIVQTLGVNRENFVEDVEAMVEHMEVEKAGGTPGLGAAVDIMDVDVM